MQVLAEAAVLSVGMETVQVDDDGVQLVLGPVTYTAHGGRVSAESCRVTLTATVGDRRHTDTLDLYAHKARQGFINQCARLFDLAREALAAQVMQVVTAVEAWARRHAEQQATPAAVPASSDADEAAGLALLRSPTLAAEVVRDLDACGYVGEDGPKLLAYLIGISRQLETPLAGIILSQSGAGKSQLAELIEALTPPEAVVLYSRLSPQALCYMEKDFLKRKLLIIEEKTGAEAADYAIRTLQTRQKITQGVVLKDPQTGRLYTKTMTVEGPIAYLVTTTAATLNYENLTRCFELYLDESREQTARIHQRQRASKTVAGLLQRQQLDGIRRRHHAAQRGLRPVRVVIPYAPLLTFPPDWLRTRRDQARFLALVEAVTFLYQQQREVKTVTDDGGTAIEYIESTVDDYAVAYRLAREVLGYTLDELGKPARELLAAIEALVAAQAAATETAPGAVVFSRRDVREWVRWPDHAVKAALRQLEELEYLGVLAGHKGKAYAYQLASPSGLARVGLGGLTTPDELQAKLGDLGKT